jgi:hypothetical protein
VDVIADQGLTLLPIEIKSGQTVSADFFSGLRKWLTWAGAEAGKPYLVYGGDERQERGEAEVVPWRDITEIAESL